MGQRGELLGYTFKILSRIRLNDWTFKGSSCSRNSNRIGHWVVTWVHVSHRLWMNRIWWSNVNKTRFQCTSISNYRFFLHCSSYPQVAEALSYVFYWDNTLILGKIPELIFRNIHNLSKLKSMSWRNEHVLGDIDSF